MHTPDSAARLRAALAEHLFCGFDIEEEAKEYLTDVFLSDSTPPSEKERLLKISLTAASEDWFLQLHHAATQRDRQTRTLEEDGLGAGDLLAFIPTIKFDSAQQPRPQPWAETDQLIRQLAESFRPENPAAPVLEGGLGVPDDTSAGKNRAEPRRRPSAPRVFRSHFWAQSEEGADAGQDNKDTVLSEAGRDSTEPLNRASEALNRPFQILPPSVSLPPANEIQPTQRLEYGGGQSPEKTSPELVQAALPVLAHPSRLREALVQPIEPLCWAANRPKLRSPAKSPFFAEPATPRSGSSPSKNNRPPAGTVSAIPFPPLDAPCFSLIQEALCHEPFWLLIAVTFLIKTSGKLAIPAFHAVNERFPSPEHLADPGCAPELMDMIRHLGLVVNRTTAVQKYARGWIGNPPTPGVRYRVRGYDKREIDLDTGPRILGQAAEPCADGDAGTAAAEEPDDAWEIGHLTQGKYALDSWRIFCRDELLGRAQDWNGKGAAPEFQPEWMRVRPNDKELRACLRWMWMKEGWEWDPVTGDKKALRPEMAAAVNERRVEYDDTGGLRILNEPRAE